MKCMSRIESEMEMNWFEAVDLLIAQINWTVHHQGCLKWWNDDVQFNWLITLEISFIELGCWVWIFSEVIRLVDPTTNFHQNADEVCVGDMLDCVWFCRNVSEFVCVYLWKIVWNPCPQLTKTCHFGSVPRMEAIMGTVWFIPIVSLLPISHNWKAL